MAIFNFRAWMLGASALPMMLGALPAVAQTTTAAAAPPSNAVNEVVVTAQKREQNINRVGMTITALPARELQERRVLDASDLTKLVPGFTFQTASNGTPIYTLRGIGYVDNTVGASPAVTVYADEVPLTFSAMSRGAIVDLERVEVLKGPQGTLYGSNSTGGAFNYIAAKPTPDFHAGAEASYGNYNTFEANGFVSGPLMPDLLGRVAVQTTQGGDWQKSYTRDAKLGAQNKTTGRTILDWKPNDRLKVAFTASGWMDQSDTQAPQLLAVTPQTPATINPGILNYPRPPHNDEAADWTAHPQDGRKFRRNDSFFQTSLRGDYDLTDHLTLTSITAYSKLNLDGFFDADGISYEDLNINEVGSASSVYQEVRLAGNTSRLHWMVGLNYENSNVYEGFSSQSVDASNSLIFPGLGFNSALITNKQSINSEAIYANVEYSITDQLRLIGGVRYTETDRNSYNCSADNGNGNLAASLTMLEAALKGVSVGSVAPIARLQCYVFNANFDPVPVYEKLDEHNIPFRATVEWEPLSGTLFYGTISRGYKAGTIPALAVINTFEYTPVTQEELIDYEVGVKTRIIPNVQINAAAFYYDYSDKQLLGKVLDPVFGVISELRNIPKSRIMGIDADVTWRPTSEWTIHAAGTYLDGQVTNYVGLSQLGVQSNFAGSALPFAPKWQFSADVNYRKPISDSLAFVADVDYSYESTTSSGFRDALLDMPAYSLVDARIGIDSEPGKWSVALWAKNLSNAYYLTNTVRGQDTAIGYTGMPRTYGVSISKRF